MVENICFIDSESILLMFQRRRYFVKIKRNFGYCVVLMIKKGTYNTDKFLTKKNADGQEGKLRVVEVLKN